MIQKKGGWTKEIKQIKETTEEEEEGEVCEELWKARFSPTWLTWLKTLISGLSYSGKRPVLSLSLLLFLFLFLFLFLVQYVSLMFLYVRLFTIVMGG